MSYKFSLDHTMLMADVHDMITIDIKPETRSTVVNGDIEITGYLAFRGSYLTPELSEELFEGYIPVDIMLPYRGGTPNVMLEVAGFDYQVESKESLTLNLIVGLIGYNHEASRVEVETAVIEPFDFAQSADAQVENSYSPLIELDERAVETIVIEPEVEELFVEDFLPNLEEESVRTNAHLTESAEALIDELFASRSETTTAVEVDEPVLEVAEKENVLVNRNSFASQFADSFRTIKVVAPVTDEV